MKVKYNNQNISNTGFAPINTYLKTELKIRKKKKKEKQKGEKNKKENIRLEFSMNKD